jgi:spoIIIJ-associated protein
MPIDEERQLEGRGEDVESAIAAGLAELGLSQSDVDIEVVDEGSSGFLGIGGREAVVRLSTRSEAPVEVSAPDESTGRDFAEAPQVVLPDMPEGDEPSEEDVALEIVDRLLLKMQVEADTTLRLSDPDDLTGEQRWIVDIRGQDMGMLIGPRGETLNSLQYLARLMTGHVLRSRPTFIVDVEGYRERRESALARLAERMAEKAVRLGRPLSLEPMPPNERRIIHITLRDHKQVYTESSGDGPRRKVRIYLKDKN